MRGALFSLAASFAGGGVAWAAEWERGAAVSLSSYYSDNICLANRDKEGEYVGTVTPDIRLKGTGARASVSLNARVELNTLDQLDTDCPGGAQGGQLLNRESVIPTGNFSADTEVVENWLTLNADAFAGQNPINPFAPGGDDGINARDNTNITYRWGAGATAARQFSGRTQFFLRYYYNEQTNAVGLLADSNENQWQGRFGMIPGTSRFTASISGQYSEVEFEESARAPAFTNELSSAQLNLAFQLTRSLQLNGYVGEEWNVFTSASDDIDGEFWDVGLRWTPNERVAVDIGTGERFFGDTPRFNVEYRHKRSIFQAGYLRTLQFPRDLRAPGTEQEDPFPPDLGELPVDPVTGSGTPTFIGQSPILNEQFLLRYSFQARRTRFSATASESQQTQVETLGEGTFRNASFAVTRQLSSLGSLSARIGYRESEGEGGNAGFFAQNATAWIGGVSYRRRIGAATSVSLGWQYTDQESDFAFNEFAENRITLSLRHTFF
ncbi:TIGR03016 family PEP-CTERM system-associated outer membrane protein [Pseudohaliea sp.]|uniref:TIGR03016 family PEP-CTERM system-associated outer membrane protein n=1 Tax=Pseudohaliea sp. TaxID=2740289 RepID=UPI0032EBAB88